MYILECFIPIYESVEMGLYIVEFSLQCLFLLLLGAQNEEHKRFCGQHHGDCGDCLKAENVRRLIKYSVY